MLAAGFPIVCEPAEAKRRPASVVEAQFSLPFGVAVALARGAASPAEFAPACLRDPTVGGLMERVVGVRDPALDAAFPRAWPCWVRIALRGRPPLEAHVEHPRGDPESFLTPAALERKFRTLATRCSRRATAAGKPAIPCLAGASGAWHPGCSVAQRSPAAGDRMPAAAR